MQINDKTTLCGSIAARQSGLGAKMHNAAYKALNLDFVFIPFTVSDAKGAIAGMRALDIRGLNVSMPHKLTVMRYLDQIDPIAKKIGAVNTVSNENGVLKGYNSDWIGALKALEEKTHLKDKYVALIGAGGAARAIAYALKSKDAKVEVYNRTLSKAKRLEREFRLESSARLSDFKGNDYYDILINATSVGMFPNIDEMPIKPSAIRENKVVMDTIINPVETRLLKTARKSLCKIVPGYRMLIHQALFQFEKYTGHKAPFEVMEDALLNGMKIS